MRLIIDKSETGFWHADAYSNGNWGITYYDKTASFTKFMSVVDEWLKRNNLSFKEGQ